MRKLRRAGCGDDADEHEHKCTGRMRWSVDVHIVDNDMDDHIRPHEHEYHMHEKDGELSWKGRITKNAVAATMLWIIDVHIVDNDMDGHIRPHEHEYHMHEKDEELSWKGRITSKDTTGAGLFERRTWIIGDATPAATVPGVIITRIETVDNDLVYRDNGAGAEGGAGAGAGVAPLEDFDDFKLRDIDTELNHSHALSRAGINVNDFDRKEDCGNESRNSRMGSFSMSSLLRELSSVLTPPQYEDGELEAWEIQT